jgi:hypothetical protein
MMTLKVMLAPLSYSSSCRSLLRPSALIGRQWGKEALWPSMLLKGIINLLEAIKPLGKTFEETPTRGTTMTTVCAF